MDHTIMKNTQEPAAAASLRTAPIVEADACGAIFVGVEEPGSPCRPVRKL
jgi:hypothetical protein